MGALSSSRKRRDDYFKFFPTEADHSYSRIAKKPKISVSAEQSTPGTGERAPSNSVAARVSRYPDRKTRLPREVHAPVRNSRFSRFFLARNSEFAGSGNEHLSDKKMGSSSPFSGYYYMVRDLAVKSLRFYKEATDGKLQAKEVIEIEDDDDDEGEKEEEEENLNDRPADYSSAKEMEIEDFTRDKLKEEQVAATENSSEKNVKMVEKEVRSLDSSEVTDGSNANTKLDDGENMRLVLLDQVQGDSEKPLYVRMLEATRRRSDDKLNSLNFEIELTKKRIQGLHLLRPQVKEKEVKKDLVEECFVPLTGEEKDEISRALSGSNRRRVLVKDDNSNIDITGEILQCLRPAAWLNDEVINLYLDLLKERERREPEKFLKCHFFNTFFYKKLIADRSGYNFQSVRRWTTKRKLGYSLIECDKIFVPIHKEIHWCLAIINNKDKKFQYLDSLKGSDARVLNVLARYFVDEVKDKCQKEIDVSSWEKEVIDDLPEQKNGFDCGMFMIKYADFYSRGIGLCFKQEHMPYFRLRTVKEILRLRAE